MANVGTRRLAVVELAVAELVAGVATLTATEDADPLRLGARLLPITTVVDLLLMDEFVRLIRLAGEPTEVDFLTPSTCLLVLPLELVKEDEQTELLVSLCRLLRLVDLAVPAVSIDPDDFFDRFVLWLLDVDVSDDLSGRRTRLVGVVVDPPPEAVVLLASLVILVGLPFASIIF